MKSIRDHQSSFTRTCDREDQQEGGGAKKESPRMALKEAWSLVVCKREPSASELAEARKRSQEMQAVEGIQEYDAW
uniref:HMG box domain-containing protein n=1 Tax=Steinernema glaseri TaxID=37863 RepID=A0A1I8AF20_9BILA